MKKVFLLVIFTCILIGCNSQLPIPDGRDARDTISLVGLHSEQVHFKLSDIVDSINYFPIPTEDNLLIGQVGKLMIVDSGFMIVDNRITNSVYLFSRNEPNGISINHYGNGPTEYLRLSDAFYNNTLNEVGIYCNLKNEILYYRLDGEYSRKCKIPYRGESIYPMERGFLLHTEYQENESLKHKGRYPDLIFVNEENDTISPICENYFKGPVNHSVVWSSNSCFSIWKDTIALKPDHSNVVYHCTSEGLYPAHFLNCGEHNLDERFWDKALEANMDIHKLEEFCRSEDLCEIIWYLESEKIISFICKQKGILTQVLYSKSSRNVKLFREIENDMDSFASFNPKAIKGNKIYGIISAYSVAQQISDKHQKVPSSLQQVEEGDNPIIVEFTLKDF